MEVFYGILHVAMQVGILSERITNTTASTIVHWVLSIGVIALLIVGIFAAIWFAIQWTSSVYKNYCWDGISVMVAIMSAAFVIFFGDWIKYLISMNQVVLLYPLCKMTSYIHCKCSK